MLESRWALIFAVAAASAALWLGGPAPVAAQDKQVSYDRYGVTFEVQPDGRVVVTEDQTVDFESGTFTNGFVQLNTRGATDIEILGVEEVDLGIQYERADRDGGQHTFRVRPSGEGVEVRWWFPETEGESRRFIVRYVLHGALRFYERGDQLWWQAIRADRPRVQAADVIVALPPQVTTVTEAIGYHLPSGDQIDVVAVDDRTVRMRAQDIEPGEALEIRVQWPHGVIAGTPSAFQQAFDVERAGEQAQIEAARDPARALINIAIGLLSALVLLGGLFGLYVMWYVRGRDVPVSMPVDYLAEPPSDLPPGVVGTLLDERSELRDVLATLIDLARRGELRMEEHVESGFMGLGTRRDFTYQHTPSGTPLPDYEDQLIRSVFDGDEARKLSDLKNDFYVHLPRIQQALYEATVDAGLFEASPEQTRRRYGCISGLGIGIAVLLVPAALAFAGTTPAVLCVPFVLGIVALGAMAVSRFMPRKTRAGAEAAARWSAFKRYLEDIESYRDLAEAEAVFDRFLPYAIAFGLEQSWIEKFARVDAPVPPWYVPHPYGGGFGRPWVDWGDGPRTLDGPEPPRAPGGGVPSLEGASRGMGGGLSSMSAGMASMLNTAAVVMTSRPAPSGGSTVSGGGGWSGGGFSAGGGGGGGGGGFG